MGLCIGASLMSFVELIDFAVNCLLVFWGCRERRVEDKGESVDEKCESGEVEDQLNACIRKIAFLEARLDGFIPTSENIEHLILTKQKKLKTDD